MKYKLIIELPQSYITMEFVARNDTEARDMAHDRVNVALGESDDILSAMLVKSETTTAH